MRLWTLLLCLLVLVGACVRAPGGAAEVQQSPDLRPQDQASTDPFIRVRQEDLSDDVRRWWEVYRKGDVSAWMMEGKSTYLMLAGGHVGVTIERIEMTGVKWIVSGVSRGPATYDLVVIEGEPPDGYVVFTLDGELRPMVQNHHELPPIELKGQLSILDVTLLTDNVVQVRGYGQGNTGPLSARILDSAGQVVGRGILRTARMPEWGSFVEQIPVETTLSPGMGILEVYDTSMEDDSPGFLIASIPIDLSPRSRLIVFSRT